MSDGESPVSGKPWTHDEIEIVVGAYADMWRRQLLGESFSKADKVRALRGRLPVRSPAAIERKFANISAILDEHGLEWIEGYKPLSHYQRDLASAVLSAMKPWPHR